MPMMPINPYITITAFENQANLSFDKRKSDGITYTPSYIAKEMVELISPEESEVVFEPSCG